MNFLQKWRLKSLQKKAKKLHQARDQGKIEPKQEIAVLYRLAKFYDKRMHDKKVPYARDIALEYYRAAAKLDDREAQYICSQRFFDKAKFWEQWAKDLYGDQIHQQYMRSCYEEAFRYLTVAENAHHVLAKRSHGLAYIHGWGVDVDTEKGFKLVLDSIEMENSWNRATKIIEELKLNSPEFFEALTKYKANRS